jgi:drug/metabolite transporter (DMT)-like permease
MVLGEHAGWPTIIGSVVTLVGVLILNSRR